MRDARIVRGRASRRKPFAWGENDYAVVDLQEEGSQDRARGAGLGNGPGVPWPNGTHRLERCLSARFSIWGNSTHSVCGSGISANIAKRLIAVQMCQQSLLLGLSQRPVMLCHPEIVASNFRRRANCCETATLVRQVAVTFCPIQCIHSAPPQNKDGARWFAEGRGAKKPSGRRSTSLT
jgi:hypothetical protein